MHDAAGDGGGRRVIHAKLDERIWLKIGIHVLVYCDVGREGGCAGHAKVDGTSGLACCYPVLLRQ